VRQRSGGGWSGSRTLIAAMRVAFALSAVFALGCAAPPPDALAPIPAPAARAAVPTAVKAADPVPGQERIALAVRETAGVARSGEVVRSGVPLPRGLRVRETGGLTVVDSGGKAVPAEFQVLARWNAGKGDTAAPIQWLLVAFPATVAARRSARYTLVTDGSAGANPAPAAPLQLRREGAQVVVDTGAAVFRLGGAAGSLFDGITPRGGGSLVTGSEMTLGADGKAGGHSGVRGVRIEHAGPLSAVVVIQGTYDLPPVGKGSFGSLRRYVFTAGSPTAVVRQAVAWEGNLDCDGCVKTKAGRPNGVLVERVRDALALDLGAPGPAEAAAVTAVGALDAPALEGTAGGEAWVRQRQRERRTAPARFEVAAAGRKSEGKKADGAMLAVSGPAGTVAIALNHMHRYEPQALRLLPDGRLAVDLVDGRAWLAHHQGLFATLAVTALPKAAARAELDRLLWAPLNRPLRAWPEASWFNASGAVAEVPAGPLPKKLAAYDENVRAVLDATEKEVDAQGIPGLMTFGVYPRYWAEDGYAGEVDCKGGDPTPGEAWDDLFWCGTWTDYHNTVATAPVWAMRSGEVSWLDEVGFPGALRVLHTQIMQCGPQEKWFYCGQAPAGYGGYREDFNSSHAYFENLFLYYWLTGDSTVVDTVRRGADSMRRLVCPTRGRGPVTEPHGPDGPACAADRPPDNDSAGFVGRVASQWASAYRFVGLASDDASFLEDYRQSLARALTLNYAELERDGRRYGFLGGGTLKKGASAGTSDSAPWWIVGFYDAENFHRFALDTGDAPLGEPALAPSRVLASLARTLVELGARRTKGAALLQAPWPRSLAYTWTGPRLGGTLTAVRQKPEASEEELYWPEKACTVALLARAARETGDPVLTGAADDLIGALLQRGKGDHVLPLGKVQGQALTRLHAAVAVAAAAPAPKKEP